MRSTTAPVPRIPVWGWLMIGESAAGEFVGANFSRAHPACEIGDRKRETRDAEVVGVVDDGNHQPFFAVDCHAEVSWVMVGDFGGFRVEGRVEDRVQTQRVDRRLGEERQKRQFYTGSAVELVLMRCA